MYMKYLFKHIETFFSYKYELFLTKSKIKMRNYFFNTYK